MFKFKESLTGQNIVLAAAGLVVGLALCVGGYFGFMALTGGLTSAQTKLESPGLTLLTQDKSPLLRTLADGKSAFYSDLPEDYSFRIKGAVGATANDLLKLIKVTNSQGQTVELQAVPDSVGFAVIPVSGVYTPGQRYKIELLAPAIFVAEDMAPWQTIYFSIAQVSANQLAFQNGVSSKYLADFVSVNGLKLVMKSGSFKPDDILILPSSSDPGAALKAYKVEAVTGQAGSFEIATSEPSFGEVFKTLAVNGRYAIQADQVEIDTAAMEARLKTDFGFPAAKVTNQSTADYFKITVELSSALPSELKPLAPVYAISLTYEDRPEFAVYLQGDGQIAFNYISDGNLQVSINFFEEGSSTVSQPDLDSQNRAAIAALIISNLQLEPDSTTHLIPLIDAHLLPASSPLAVNLQVDLDWAALMNGSFKTQMTAVNAFDAELELFAGTPLTMATASPTASQLQGFTLLGRAEYSGALQTHVDMSLLQFAEISLASENVWRTRAFGQFNDWTSNPTFAAQKFNGYLSSDGQSQIIGALISRISAQPQKFPDLQIFKSEAVMIGPVGNLKLPLAMSTSEPITFDETITLGKLPAIAIEYYNFENFQKQVIPVKPQDLTFSLGDSVLILENGQLPLPAALPLGDTTIIISLISDPKIQGTLTLTKVKPLLSSDLRYIAGLLKMHKAEVLAMLGSGYTEMPIGADGWMDGYAYAASGLTLAFYPEGMTALPADGITEDDLDRVIFVYCDDKIDLNDARVGMTPVQVVVKLGAPTQFYAASDYYPMNTYRYVIGNLEIDFVSSGDDQATVFAYVTTKKA